MAYVIRSSGVSPAVWSALLTGCVPIGIELWASAACAGRAWSDPGYHQFDVLAVRPEAGSSPGLPEGMKVRQVRNRGWVETRGLEPLTPALQRRCSAS